MSPVTTTDAVAPASADANSDTTEVALIVLGVLFALASLGLLFCCRRRRKARTNEPEDYKACQVSRVLRVCLGSRYKARLAHGVQQARKGTKEKRASVDLLDLLDLFDCLDPLDPLDPLDLPDRLGLPGLPGHLDQQDHLDQRDPLDLLVLKETPARRETQVQKATQVHRENQAREASQGKTTENYTTAPFPGNMNVEADSCHHGVKDHTKGEATRALAARVDSLEREGERETVTLATAATEYELGVIWAIAAVDG
ncbi:hypothetical protein B0T19DRAFT_436076 [Cercophora scortea]|uniref:Uncharacterized protein n=1 Tax=Cercophora scortea TaxID=314031 RepID=A0AAE0MJW4_9PEZI|nr:hypothetical protein B0T19DRAFT_436076 [Cercophora scortea]